MGRQWVREAVPPGGGGGANTEQDVLIEGGKERQIYKCIYRANLVCVLISILVRR